MANINPGEATIKELLTEQAEAERRQREWDSAMVGYTLMVGLSRRATDIMVGTGFGGLRDDGNGEYFQSDRFIIGHNEGYELGGLKSFNTITAALTIIDSSETFQLALVGENSFVARATAGRIPFHGGDPINNVLEHPDSMSEHALAVLDEYPRIIEGFLGPAPPPWWAETLGAQTRSGINIWRLAIAALADTEYNPGLACGHIALRLSNELCFYDALQYADHGGLQLTGLDVKA